MKNINCPHEVAEDAKFCPDCGVPVGPPPQIPGPKVEQVEPNAASLGMEFAYFVSEQQLHNGATDKAFPPYGCIGVVVVNGRVERMYNQASATIKAGQASSSPIKDLFQRLSGGFKDLVAYRQNLLTYVLSSLRELPVVTYTRKPDIPGSVQALLKFEFWINHPISDIDASKLPDLNTAEQALQAARAANPVNPAAVKAAEEQLQQIKVLGNIGVFLTKYLSGKAVLTYTEFKRIAIEQVEMLMASYRMQQLVDEQSARNQLMSDLEKLTGISGRCTYDSGRQLQRYQMDVSTVSMPVECPSCKATYTSKVKFCEHCAHDMSATSLWVDKQKTLMSKEGEPITLRLSLYRDLTNPNSGVPFSDGLIALTVITELEPLVRRTSLDQMLDLSYLKVLTDYLNQKLPADWQNFVKDFEVIDLRTTKEDWLFRTDALVAEQLRLLEADKRGLAVGEAELDLEEVKFALAMREVRMRDDEHLTRKRQEYETARKAAELDAAQEVEDHARETQTELKKEQLDTQAYSERAVMERQRMASDRQTTDMLRQNEHAEVDHDMSIEKKVAGHDIDLREMQADADSRQTRRTVDDNSYGKRSEVDDETYAREQDLRIQAETKQKLGNIDQDLEDRKVNRDQSVQDREQNRQIDKLRAMAELEAKMAEQDQLHEMNKAKLEKEAELAKEKLKSETDLAKRENMKNLSAAEMLAIQAAELAQAGGAAAAADIVKAIAESQAAAERAKAEAAGTGIKEEMYERMLKMQMESTQATIAAHQGAAAMAQSVNEKAMEQMAKVSGAAASQSLEGYKSAAEIAQSTNEKSMDSMARVATATASRKGPNEKDAPEKYKCTACGKEFDKPILRFCSECGKPQQ